MRGCGWKRSPSKFKLCFLLCFPIVQEAERVLFLNFKPKFQSGWNGSSEKWGTDGGQKGKSEKLNEKRAYDFTRKPLNSQPRRIKFQVVILRNYRIFLVLKIQNTHKNTHILKIFCWTLKQPAGRMDRQAVFVSRRFKCRIRTSIVFRCDGVKAVLWVLCFLSLEYGHS